MELQSSGHGEMPASRGGNAKAEELDRSRPRSSWAGVRNTRDGSSAGAQEVRGSELVGSGAHFAPAPARISPHLLKLHQSNLPARLFQCPPGPLQPTLPKPVLLFTSYQSSDQTPSQAVPCWSHPAWWALHSTAFPSCSGAVGQQWSHSSSQQPCWKHPSQQVPSPRFPPGGCSVGREGGAAPSLQTPGLQSCAWYGWRDQAVDVRADQRHLALFSRRQR